MLYSIILACTLDGGIGYNNHIPWDVRSDLILFRQITTKTTIDFKQNAIIMGRKTWDSLMHKPLKDRINIVITNDNNFIKSDNIYSFNSLDKAFEFCENSTNIDKVFVIGGKTIYDLCLNNEKYNNIEYLYLSVIYKYYKCNVFINFKNILTKFTADINNIIFNPQFLHMKMIKK
jgi:dihydrofolate reductase